jgi:hypothetical protein
VGKIIHIVVAGGGREVKIIIHSTNCDNESGCDPYENASAAAL